MAKKTEDVIEKKMKDSVRSQKIEASESAREHMAVATLGYGLTVLNKMIDNLPRAGYQLDGFMEAFDDPRTQEESGRSSCASPERTPRSYSTSPTHVAAENHT